MSFGKKVNRDFGKFAKKLGVKRNFGRKLVNTIEKVGSVVGRVADIAALANPELAGGAAAVKGISSQAGGLARSGVELTGKQRPDFGKIEEQIGAVKQGAKELKQARDVLQKKKPIQAEEAGVQFTD